MKSSKLALAIRVLTNHSLEEVDAFVDLRKREKIDYKKERPEKSFGLYFARNLLEFLMFVGSNTSYFLILRTQVPK